MEHLFAVGGSAIDRCNNQIREQTFVECAQAHPQARYFIFIDGNPLVNVHTRRLYTLPSDDEVIETAIRNYSPFVGETHSILCFLGRVVEQTDLGMLSDPRRGHHLCFSFTSLSLYVRLLVYGFNQRNPHLVAFQDHMNFLLLQSLVIAIFVLFCSLKNLSLKWYASSAQVNVGDYIWGIDFFDPAKAAQLLGNFLFIFSPSFSPDLVYCTK